jgi:hypothetical protein
MQALTSLLQPASSVCLGERKNGRPFERLTCLCRGETCADLEIEVARLHAPSSGFPR